MQWPVDAPKQKVIKALERIGFRVDREREHISLKKENPDGSETILILPNHKRIKSSTLRTACTCAKISREEFLKQYYK